MVGYSPAEQVAAEKEVLRVLATLESPNAPLSTGPHCTYCKAKLVCPALRSQSLALADAPVAESLAVSNADLAAILDRCGAAKKFIGAAQAEAKRRIAAGEAVPGWELTEGAGKREITSAQSALEALTPLGLTVDGMLPCVSVRIGQLEKATRKASGLKGRAFEEQFNAALSDAGCLTRKQTAPKLHRIGAALEDGDSDE